MLTAVERVVTRWMGRRSPWTNAYGLARSLLALGTALTLVFNDSTVMFHPLAGMGTPPKCESLAAGTLFCRLPHSLELARWVAIAILLIVASGWRPRVTGVLHWWVAWSLAVSGSVVDGGDQIAAVIALVMIPMTITDPRRWHWDAPTVASTEAMPRARLVAFSSAIALRVQVAGIYFHAAVAKFAVPEWADGTAVYYSAIDPVIGQGPWIAPLFSIPVVVVAATWGTLAFETLLFTGLVMDTRWRRPLLVAAFAFHATIVVLHGLFSFFFTMASGLLLFLHPVDSPWPRIDRAWRRMRAVAGTRLTPALGRRIAVALFGLSTSGCYVGLPADEHPRCGRITELASRAVADGASPGLVLAVRSPQGHCDIAVGREGPTGPT
ncbi:MAG: HTTM domain-containing protein [Deltaproteobacteria bacterium]|nr:HTTM domain-containing protein [Deltaproteobacteria bacterium]